MAFLYSTRFTPGEPLRNDDASCAPGANSIEEYIKLHWPEATELAPIVVGQWPIGPRYFKCRDSWGNDFIRAVWFE